nr:protein trichome birefringence-like 14 [Tanacetum cinerariifolium]
MEISWFDKMKNSSGLIGEKMSSSAAYVKGLVGDNLSLLVQNMVTTLSGLIISADTKKLYEEASQVATDAVGSIRTIASFCAKDKVMKLYEKKCEVDLMCLFSIRDITGKEASLMLTDGLCMWVNGKLLKYHGLKAFYRSISPRHFFNGDGNSRGTCDSTTHGLLEVIQDESTDFIVSKAMKRIDVKLLDITTLSQVRDGYISRYSIKATPGVQDCLHWCLPGIPNTWNELLFTQI